MRRTSARAARRARTPAGRRARRGGPRPRTTRRGIDHGDADAVQTAGGLVGALLELAAELEHGHHAFERRDIAPMLGSARAVDGDAAAVVFDGDRAVVVDRDARCSWRSRPSPRRSSCRRLRRPGGAGRAASVSPMYMPGRSRTCSRSLRCWRSLAPYSASPRLGTGGDCSPVASADAVPCGSASGFSAWGGRAAGAARAVVAFRRDVFHRPWRCPARFCSGR